MAKAAGADVVMPLGSLTEQIAVMEGFRGAVRDGELPRTTFTATAERLDRVRGEYRLTHKVPPFAMPSQEMDDEAMAVAVRSVTVQQGREALPLAGSTRLAVIDCARPRWSQAEEAIERPHGVLEFVQEEFPLADGVVVGATATDGELARAREVAAAAEAILFVTRDAERDGFQERLGRGLVGLGVPVVHAAVRGPYDAGIVPGAATTLLTYGDPAVSVRAMVAILAGRFEPVGSLPVRLPSRET